MKKVFAIVLCLVMVFSISAVSFAAKPSPPTPNLSFSITTDYDAAKVANLHKLAVTNIVSDTAQITVNASALSGYQNARILCVSSNGKTYAISDPIGNETKPYTVPKKIGNNNSTIADTAYLVLGDELVTVGNADLEAAIASANAINVDDYTLLTYTNLQTAISSAQAEDRNPASTQADIDAAIASLNTAISALVYVGELRTVIEELRVLVVADTHYDQQAKDSTMIQLDAFESQLDTMDYLLTQSDIDYAIVMLYESIAMLYILELNDEITQAQSLNSTDYTQSSWDNMQSALTQAIDIYNGTGPATKEQLVQFIQALIQAKNDLHTAIGNLVPITG